MLSKNEWTPEMDAYLRQAYKDGNKEGLARAVADHLGNSPYVVINRAKRLGLIPSNTKNPLWTPSEDALLESMLKADIHIDEIAKLLGRSTFSTSQRRHKLGLSGYTRKNSLSYSAKDKAILTEMYLAHESIEDIAKRLKRTTGSIKQHVLRLGLTRDNRKTQAVKYHGKAILAFGKDIKSIRKAIIKLHEDGSKQVKMEKQKHTIQVLHEMDVKLAAGVDRKEAFTWAVNERVTMQAIGDHVGLSRERVRQLVDGIKPGKKSKSRRVYNLTCIPCGAPIKGARSRRYCDRCLTNKIRASSRITRFKSLTTEV